MNVYLIYNDEGTIISSGRTDRENDNSHPEDTSTGSAYVNRMVNSGLSVLWIENQELPDKEAYKVENGELTEI